MAITVEELFTGINFKSYRITATDDLDEVIQIDHDLALPPIVILMPMIPDVCALSSWACYSAGLDKVSLKKQTLAGSGFPGHQLTVFLLVPGARVLG